jgi:knotted carbamoyltransferase YgeW
MDPRRGPDAEALSSLHRRHLLETRDWSREQILALCDLAELLAARDAEGRIPAVLSGELHYGLFFDASTRTKSAWAGAAARLGAHPVLVDGATTQVSHGESARETGTMLGMNAHALGIRHDRILGEGNRFLRDVAQGIDAFLEHRGETRHVPVVNLQCDVDHPTQTLADLCWLRERFPGGLEGVTVAVTWAYAPSYAKPLSVPQGLVTLLPRFGARVRLAHPPGYELLPEVLEAARELAAEGGGSLELLDDMDAAFRDADVVYPKSWGPLELMRRRVEANRAGDEKALGEIEREALARNARHRDWICDEARMHRTRGALYMHCLPADVGSEVTPGVFARARWDLARQAQKKLYVIMATLLATKHAEALAALGRS